MKWQDKCSELEILLKDEKAKTKYYQKIAKMAGERNLREISKLSEIINDYRRAEEALRESEGKYHNLYDNAPDMYFTVSPDGIITSVNQFGAECIGYTKEDLIGKPIWVVVHNVDLDRVREHFNKIFSQRLVKSELEFRKSRKDGSTFWTSESTHLMLNENGTPIELCIICRDITDRKQAEKALQESEERFRKIFEEGPLGMAIIGSDCRFIKANATLCQMFGYTEEEFTKLKVFDLTFPDDIDSHEKDAKRLFEGEIPYCKAEIRYIKKNNEIFWTSRTATAIRNEKGTFLYFLIMVEDITNRQKMEEELRRSHEKLRNLSTYLQQAREEERRHIAREIHDELGQMLTALKMDFSWISKKLPKDQNLLLEKINSIDGLIDMSIQSVQRISSELRPGLLDDLGITSAIEWQANEFQNRAGIQCKLTLDPEDIILERDLSTAIFRIFQETLTNVARHANATKVKVDFKEKDGTVTLIVRDNGRGITEEQISDPKSLGLIGMRERLHPLGGSSKIKGVKGKGTIITVSIPLSKKEIQGRKAHLLP